MEKQRAYKTNPAIQRIFYCLARAHKRDGRFLSVSSTTFRSVYRHLAKQNGWPTAVQAEMECFNFFFSRDNNYSRTDKYTKRATWNLPSKFDAPVSLSLADLPSVPEDRHPVFAALCEFYSSRPLKQRNYWFAAIYTLALRTTEADYLYALREFFISDETWSDATCSFWNTGLSACFLNNKQTRSVLLGEGTTGFDISNAFPVLLSQMLDNKNIPHSYIRSYAQDRDSIIDLLVEEKHQIPVFAKPLQGSLEGVSDERQAAKKTLLATLFGQRVKEEDNFFIKNLSGEVKEIRKEHFQDDPTQMSYALYAVLGQIQVLAKEFFGTDLIATVADCFYVAKTSKRTKADFQEHILDVLGFDVRFGDKE